MQCVGKNYHGGRKRGRMEVETFRWIALYCDVTYTWSQSRELMDAVSLAATQYSVGDDMIKLWQSPQDVMP